MVRLESRTDRLLALGPGKLIGKLELVSVVRRGCVDAGSEVQAAGAAHVDPRQDIVPNGRIHRRQADRGRRQNWRGSTRVGEVALIGGAGLHRARKSLGKRLLRKLQRQAAR